MTDSFIRRQQEMAEEDALYEPVEELTDNPVPPKETEEQPKEDEEDKDFVVFDGQRYHKDNVVFKNGVPVRPMTWLEGNNPIQDAGVAMGMGLIDRASDTFDYLLGISDEDIARNTDIDPDDVPSLKKMWDEVSNRDGSQYKSLRKISSVVLPAIYGAGGVNTAVSKLGVSGLTKGAITVAGDAAVDLSILETDDELAQDDNAMRAISDAMPGVFGPKGFAPIPDQWKTLDSDSPEIRKYKNQRESVALSVAGNVVGFLAEKGLNPLRWFYPQDKVSRSAKQAAARNAADPDTQFRLLEIEEALATKPSDYHKDVLTTEYKRLLKQLDETGSTDVNVKSAVENHMERAEGTQIREIDNEAAELLEAGAAYYEPSMMPRLARAASTATQSTPPLNVARNMADVTYLKTTGAIGDAAPVLSPSMTRQANVLGRSRNAVLGVAEAARDAGNFDAIINGFRVTRAGMSNAAWKVYTDIMNPGMSSTDLKNLFLDDRATQVLLDGTKVDFLNEVQNLGAELAMRDLIDLYLGRQVTESSARIMDTFGREISSFAQGAETFKEIADDNRVQEMVLDKLEFLMAEHGLNKYISGWMLNNKGILTRLQGKSDDAYELAQLINSEFTQAKNARHAKIKEFRESIETARRENPQLLKPLMDAFRHSDGDVSTIAALYKWVDKQLSFKSLFYNREGGMNMFSRELWSVRYNNVLSGLAAGTAAIGNSADIVLKVTNGLAGAAVQLPFDQGKALKRVFYLHHGILETSQRALRDGIKRARQVNADPDAFMEAIRKDYRVATENRKWEILEGMEEAGELDFGRQVELNLTRGHHNMSRNGYMRWGVTGMSGIDAGTDTFMGTLYSRIYAHHDVMERAGDITNKADMKKVLEASEKLHYSKMFDKSGLLTDEAAKFASQEIALNLDSKTATWINSGLERVPALKSLFMFPRTSINYLKKGFSYTPIGAIPGINKYGTTIWAKESNPESIAKALAAHGIEYDNNPYAIAIFRQLKNEYLGRVTMGAIAGFTFYQYALQGRLRGNGPVSPTDRKFAKDNFSYTEKTIYVPGVNQWISYAGIPLLDPVLSIVGDMAMYKNQISEDMEQDIMRKIGWTLSATWLNGSPLAGLEPALKMINGEEGALKRFAAREVRAQIPMSGSLGVVSQMIDNSLKDIHKDLKGYLFNRLPGANATLPRRIDHWTGNEINLIDNPILRALNEASPVAISDGGEPWRIWVHSTGWPGMRTLTQHSKGYQYDANQREAIGRYVGSLGYDKRIEREFMNNKAYNDDIETMRRLRQSGDLTTENFELKASKLPLYQALDELESEARQAAEAFIEREYPEILLQNVGQDLLDKQTSRGDLPGAIDNMNKLQKNVEELEEVRQLNY